jgi:FHS family glucose/mannose:H+ symporter-like MFS transporter
MGNPKEVAVPGPSALTPTVVAHAAFVPTGIVTVLLGPLLPMLAARWLLTDAEAGDLFTAQFLASTGGVALSGLLVPRFGYRLALLLGLMSMALGVVALEGTTWGMGVAAVSCYGIGFGLTTPTSNLLVAEANPDRKAVALSLLNFSWSVGAVACPLLVSFFQKSGQTTRFLDFLGAGICLVAISLVGVRMPAPRADPSRSANPRQSLARLLGSPTAVTVGALFFLYVGSENAVGGWLASYAKRFVENPGVAWITTPSYFYGSLLLGRLIVPTIFDRIPEVKLARSALALAIAGVAALVASRSMPAVRGSACLIGVGLAPVYPITIAWLSNRFGAASTRLGSVMFALAGFGAASMPWLVGFASTESHSLKLGLTVPLVGCILMLGLYFRDWSPDTPGLS